MEKGNASFVADFALVQRPYVTSESPRDDVADNSVATRETRLNAALCKKTVANTDELEIVESGERRHAEVGGQSVAGQAREAAAAAAAAAAVVVVPAMGCVEVGRTIADPDGDSFDVGVSSSPLLEVREAFPPSPRVKSGFCPCSVRAPRAGWVRRCRAVCVPGCVRAVCNACRWLGCRRDLGAISAGLSVARRRSVPPRRRAVRFSQYTQRVWPEHYPSISSFTTSMTIRSCL